MPLPDRRFDPAGPRGPQALHYFAALVVVVCGVAMLVRSLEPRRPAAEPPRASPPLPQLPGSSPAPPDLQRGRAFSPPAPAQSLSASDAATLDALRRNCEASARNNADGEYPALQQMACSRYATFAAQQGVATGPLPAIRVAPEVVPQPAPAPVARAESGGDDGFCAALKAEKLRIDERMRRGYGEPEGTWMRERLRWIHTEQWRLHCQNR